MSLTANHITIQVDTATVTEAQPSPTVRINHVWFMQTVPQWTPCTLTRPAHIDASAHADDPPGHPTYTALDGHAVRNDLNVPSPRHSVPPAGAVVSKQAPAKARFKPHAVERTVGTSWLVRVAAALVALLGIGGGL